MPGITAPTLPLLRRRGIVVLVLLLCLGWTASLAAQDPAADMLLDSARRAYNEKNYPFAATRFREFLTRFGNHKQAPAAHYGLALALLDGPEKDYKGALDQLQPLATNKDSADHPFVLYYLGLSQRGLGVKDLQQAQAKPQEAVALRTSANQHFSDGARSFGEAVTAFSARVKTPPAQDAKPLPVDLEWASRARCDQAEMLLRLVKGKEAQAAVAPLLKEPALARSRYHHLGIYYHGFASFLQKDYLDAGRALNQLTPFTDPVFGTHARYLLARVHHLEKERAEAAYHYEGLLADYVKAKQTAVEALKKPDQLKNDPEEKARLEALVRGPAPDHVARASFYLGVLQYENGKFTEARDRFAAFVQQDPKSALASEAQLRQGFCQVQLKQPLDAIRTLQPLADRDLRLADQALLWVAKAQSIAVEPDKGPAYDQALKTALDTFRKAADKAQQRVTVDPDAKARRAEILLEMADTQQLARQYKEAAATYTILLNDRALPQREEEVLLHQATAYHLAGDYTESDKVCARFQQAHPRGTLLPAVLFRHAENAYFAAQAVAKNANTPERLKELAQLRDESIRRYRVLVEKYPDFAHAGLARFGLAMTYYAKGDLEKAKDTLAAIPAAERTGDLAQVPYVHADCLIRLAPTKADDALAAGRMEEHLKEASELLEAYISGQPNGPHTADALLKLGLCQQRLASLNAQPQERARAFQMARATYERLLQQFGKDPLMPQAVLERAKCIAQSGDANGAVNELRRFTNDPLKSTPVAPLALMQLASQLRAQNKAREAVDVLAQCRQQHEPNLLKDPTRAAWVPLLQYNHAVALRQAGRFSEARTLFEALAKQTQSRPETADAALRFGQCLKEEGLVQVENAQQKLATANLKPEELTAANKALQAGLSTVREAVQYLENQAEQWKQKEPASEVRARLIYEAAWGSRALGESEVAALRVKLQKELWDKLRDEIARKTAPGRVPGAIPLPEVPLSAVPLQPGEQRARSQYQALIAGFADLPLAVEARFELAEVLAERNEHDAAVKLLREALDKEPSPELTEKIRLRLGAVLAAKGDAKGALAQFQAVATNAKSPYLGQARYRLGECYMQKDEWANAARELAIFRDQQPFQNLPGITDRALLRLGHALANLKLWDQSRQAHEQVVGRFGNSPWVHEARYGIGWAWQNQKQYDQAVNAFTQVTNQTSSEVAAKAQLQIGLCRLEQKRYPEAATALLVVPFTYDYPELSAGALCEAARTFTELKQPAQAIKLLERVLRDHPQSKWAEVARERLQGLKGG